MLKLSLIMLLPLLPLICMFAAAAAQRTYYCNSSAGVIRDSDFYLETRNQNEEFNTTNFLCEFNAESISVAFLVQIDYLGYFWNSSIVLTLDSMGSTLFSGSQLADYQKAFVTPSSNLRVRFNITKKGSDVGGTKLRVRAFDTNRCPPDWGYLYGNCYGRNIVFKSDPSGNLNYTNAQKACSNMRSNLLHLPSNYAGSLISFRNLLPGYLRLDRYNTWIGLTDRSSQYRHTWLNGDRQISTDEISCYYEEGSSTSCYPYERCGAFIYSNRLSTTYAIEMDNCNKTKNYACFMPPGGTGNFYSVPYQNDSGIVYPRTKTNTYVDSGVIWGSIVGGIVIISIIVGAVYGGIRYSQMRRAAGASATVPPPRPGF